jgi:large subunit ribosomal protein L17
MRHGVKLNQLGRTSAHRKALLSGLACELIRHKRITTTLAKAKALRVYVEPLLTKSKTNTTHQRRVVFSYLNDKHAITELFGPISEKIADRPGGYTRIIKMGKRLGDAAEVAMIELVDYNEIYTREAPGSGKKRRTRRSGGGAKKKEGAQTEKKEAAPQVVEAPEAPEAEAKTPPADAAAAAGEAASDEPKGESGDEKAPGDNDDTEKKETGA